MSKLIDLYIDQGSDFVAMLPAVTTASGAILDLTGYNILSLLRRSYATAYAVEMNWDVLTEIKSLTITSPGTGYRVGDVLSFGYTTTRNLIGLSAVVHPIQTIVGLASIRSNNYWTPPPYIPPTPLPPNIDELLPDLPRRDAVATVKSVNGTGGITAITISDVGLGYAVSPSVNVISSAGQGGVITSALKATYIELSMPKMATAGLTPTRYVYDVVIEEPGTNWSTKVFEGLATVNPGVSSKPNTNLLSPYVPEDYGGI